MSDNESFLVKLKNFLGITHKFDGIKYLWENTRFNYFLKLTGFTSIILLIMWVVEDFIILLYADILLSSPSALLASQIIMAFIINLFLLYFFFTFINLFLVYWNAKKLEESISSQGEIKFLILKKEYSTKTKFRFYIRKHYILFPILAIIFTFIMFIIPGFNLQAYTIFFSVIVGILFLLTFLSILAYNYLSAKEVVINKGRSFTILVLIIIPVVSGIIIDIIISLLSGSLIVGSTYFISFAIMLFFFSRDVLDKVGDDLREESDRYSKLISKSIFYTLIFLSTIISLINTVGLGIGAPLMTKLGTVDYVVYMGSYFSGLLIFITVCDYIVIVYAILSE
ncbi:MAG: hypothetical protein JSV23_02355 [Promethearchaeota archaeon]|nr:MAG: hypothetical protein JSV23_02355 [Candidatus Lokiarchaeota archaeon]